jgi:hypothetical protein
MKGSSIISTLGLLARMTLILGSLYLAVQQSYRMGANDPQIQMAQDIADRISEGRSVDHYFAGDTLDIARSLGLFVSQYDAGGAPLRSTGFLHGEMPRLPGGVFAFTKEYGEDRISWQPERGVRMALVIAKIPGANSGFVASGRSLAEVESRVSNLGEIVFIAWIACFVILVAEAFMRRRFP